MKSFFPTFFSAGFESSAGWIEHRWVDAVEATQHDKEASKDYNRIKVLGLKGARESLRWPLIEKHPGRYSFESAMPIIEASRKHDVQVLWDLFHFGYPSSIHPLDENFAERFAEYCYCAARFIVSETDGPYMFAPVNEPSFFSYIAGQSGRFAPYLTDGAWDLKIALARAAILGINALRAAAPHCRIVNVDPVCRVVAPKGDSSQDVQIADYNDRLVFQTWDMIAGQLHPELGGSREHLDIVGINYYWTNQWEYGDPAHPLEEHDERYMPLHDLLRVVWERYGAEMLLTETAHGGPNRAAWIATIATEAAACIEEGLPLRGVCIYPIIGMYDWYEPEKFVNLGLWDLARIGGNVIRVPYLPAIKMLHSVQRMWSAGAFLGGEDLRAVMGIGEAGS